MKLFELFATLGLDTSGFDSGLNGAKSSMSKAAKTMQSIGKGMVSVGKTAASAAGNIISGTEQALGTITKVSAAAYTAAKAVTTAILKQTYDVRSSVEQGVGGAEAVFGNYAKDITRWAEKSWESAGISMAGYYETANKMGALFQGSGFSQYESVNMTIEAMQRAADVASIMGISVEDAMYSISGAAKGNFTMLDNLGVPINDTILSAYALEKGLKQSVEQMTIGEKVALAMQKFMEDTAYAAGNYAKENETAAGSMATLQAAWSNFLAGNLGFDRVVDSAYNAMSIALKTVGLDAYQPFLDSARDTVNEVVKILGMEDTGGGDSKTKQIADLLSAKFAAVFDDLAETAPAAVENLFTGITEVLTSLETVLPSATQAGRNIFDAVRQGFEQAKAPLLSAAQSIAGDAVGAFLSFKGDMLTTGLEFIGAFAQGISDDLAKGEGSEIQKALNEGIGDVLEAMTFSIPAMGKAAVGLIRALAQSLGDESVATELSNMVSTLIGDIGALLADGEFWSGLGNAVLNIGTGLLTGIFDGLGQAAANIWNAIANQDDGSVPESVKTLQKAFTGIMTDSRAAEGAYASAMGDIQARAELAEKYLDVLQAYEQLEDPDEAMTQDALNATQALLNLYPQLKENIDSNTGFFSDNTAAIRENIAALQDLARQQAYEKLTGEMTASQADLIVQKVNAQAELTGRQAAYDKAQADYRAFQGYSESRWENRNENGYYQLNTMAAQLMKDALGAETFANAFKTLEDGSAISTGNRAKIYDPLFAGAEEYYANQLAAAETNVATVQETMTAINAAIAETQAKAAELTATWQATYGTAVTEAGAAASAANSVKTALDSIEGTYTATIVLNTDGSLPDGIGDHRDGEASHASGLGYVPYDNYVSRLHRGEMVLTRQQAEGYRQGASSGRPAEAGRQYAVSASLNVGSMTLNNGMDAQRVAQALSRETTRQVRALGRRKG